MSIAPPRTCSIPVMRRCILYAVYIFSRGPLGRGGQDLDLERPTKTYWSCRMRDHLPLGVGVAFGVVYSG